MRKIVARAFLLRELLRYGFREISARPTGTVGLFADEFLANEVLRGAYGGQRLAIVLQYVISIGLAKNRVRAIDLVLACCPVSLPLERFNTADLELLQTIASRQGHGTVATTISKYLIARRVGGAPVKGISDE